MEDYSKVIFCTEQTIVEQEYFYSIQPMGVQACVVNLTIGQDKNNLLAEGQIKMAQKAGMMVHASHIARFTTPEEARNEAKAFVKQSKLFNLPDNAIHTLIFTPTVADNTAVNLINFFQEMLYLQGYRQQDLCVEPELLTNNILDVSRLHPRPNLTLIDYKRLYPSVVGVGTWTYADKYLDEHQIIAYDFMDFYVKPNQLRGRQLSLDTEYVAKSGDSYWLISRQLGIKLAELLLLNNAKIEDKVVPGQRIKIA